MLRRTLYPILSALLLIAAGDAQAQTARETLEAASTPVDTELRNHRSMALGGAFVAGGSGGGAIRHNPASVGSAAVFEAVAGYQRNFGSDTNAIGGSIVDAKTNPQIAAGFGYSFGFGTDDRLAAAFRGLGDEVRRTNPNIRQHDIRGALAFPLVPQKLSLGVGLHYVNHFSGSWRQQIETSTEVEVTDADGEPTGETETRVEIESKEFELRTRGVTLDAGVVAQISDNFGVGFAALNLLSIDGYHRGRRMEAGFGGYFGGAHVEIAYFTEQQPDDSWGHGAAVGFEYLSDAAAGRVGFRYDDALGASFVTGGFGFRSNKFGGDLGYEQNVTDTSDRRFGASLALYF